MRVLIEGLPDTSAYKRATSLFAGELTEAEWWSLSLVNLAVRAEYHRLALGGVKDLELPESVFPVKDPTPRVTKAAERGSAKERSIAKAVAFQEEQRRKADAVKEEGRS